MGRRYLTADLPGIGGHIKERPEDFRVEEIPLYRPGGVGEHTYFEIEKVGLSTFEAVRRVARALGMRPRDVGYAGLKDAQAVTRQTLSVHGVPPGQVLALNLPHIEVLWAERHTNKLKVGHLRGNRFTIRVRGVGQEALEPCRAVLEVLARRGVPNYFGEQRFGMRGNSHLLGRAIVRQDWVELTATLLGRPHPGESEEAQAARRAFDEGDWPRALELFPHNLNNERRALAALIHSGGDHERAYLGLPKEVRRFFVSAYQSHLFNRVLDARLETLDRVFAGDLAYKHDSGASFRVEDPAVEQPRADRFEISPSGPIYGYKLLMASGEQGQLEQRILDEEALTLDDFRVRGLKLRGGRRPLRFPVWEPQVWYDEGVVLDFALPKGCYATTVLGEVMKP